MYNKKKDIYTLVKLFQTCILNVCSELCRSALFAPLFYYFYLPFNISRVLRFIDIEAEQFWWNIRSGLNSMYIARAQFQNVISFQMARFYKVPFWDGTFRHSTHFAVSCLKFSNKILLVRALHFCCGESLLNWFYRDEIYLCVCVCVCCKYTRSEQ